MTTDQKILEMHFRYQIPVRKIAQLLETELHWHLGNKKRGYHKVNLPAITYVGQVIAVEKYQIMVLKSAYFELKKDKIAI
jgi:hypothetical protein